MKSVLRITVCCGMAVFLNHSVKAQTPPTAPVGSNAPAFFAPANGGKGAPFSSEISADFIKKVMETSAKIEEIKKQVAERQSELYASHPQIKAYRKELIRLQNEINAILDQDKELNDLKMSRDILWTTMPVLPKPRETGMPRPTTTK
jgi:hypothetical protein